MASLHRLLSEKGILTTPEIDTMLRRAEAGITGDDRFSEEIPLASRDAMCFPIRLLRLANNQKPDEFAAGFSELARGVGLTKQPFNDQR
jgi:hypothetical protein